MDEMRRLLLMMIAGGFVGSVAAGFIAHSLQPGIPLSILLGVCCGITGVCGGVAAHMLTSR